MLRSAALAGRSLRLLTGVTTSRSLSTSTATAGRSTHVRDAIISVGLLTSAYALYRYGSTSTSTSTSSLPKTFTITVGKSQYTFPRLSNEAVDTMLHEHETSARIGRTGNPVIKWDRNWVGSNEPCEDRSAVDVIPRDAGDLVFFSVLDGHGGDATSKLLVKTLHPTLALSLASLKAGFVPSVDNTSWSAFIKKLNPLSYLEEAWTPSNVILSLQKAFLTLDENICQTPLKLLPTLKEEGIPEFIALAEPANAGACAISTVVDAAGDGLYVALAGDCRAVAGWQDAEGKWRCDVLTEDQMGENPREIARLQAEHPRERDTVISAGRIQGGLQPTRAFGDAVYKWSRTEHQAVKAAFSSQGLKTRSQRPTHLTPPYVTARPEVTYRKIHPSNKETLRFVIMATDGLWDRITSEEATLLLASYLSHPTHPDIPKTTLPTLFPLHPPAASRLYPAEDMPGSSTRSSGGWVYSGDENAATHLIRNSLAGSDRQKMTELLSVNGKVARWLRDDITVTVAFFGDDTPAIAKST
ncbi:phosphatase 2C-like domain-containing protein [Naematelia encephala]|uniref:Phosphatase 2C-like domain-containing protein n=1 Tax=Naematelia encephala TaxID=71784 RepID=A0A1Y2ALT6_9TREE|nr:phosphatase 2C-like domain-containing protein [Naematelia encephala]